MDYNKFRLATPALYYYNIRFINFFISNKANFDFVQNAFDGMHSYRRTINFNTILESRPREIYFAQMYYYFSAFLLIFLLTFCIYITPISGIISLILLLRGVAIFLLAPASVFTYYLDVYIWLFIGPILWYIEFMDRKSKNG
jgi:hypothetical protein